MVIFGQNSTFLTFFKNDPFSTFSFQFFFEILITARIKIQQKLYYKNSIRGICLIGVSFRYFPKKKFSKREVKIYCQMLQSIWPKPPTMREVLHENGPKIRNQRSFFPYSQIKYAYRD
jgi:hypothetical protein